MAIKPEWTEYSNEEIEELILKNIWRVIY